MGTAIEPSDLSREFKRVLKKAGLPEEARFHDLRHACATLLIVMGVHPRVVMEILGHSQIGTTMNIYAHVLPRVQREAVTGLDALFAEHDQDVGGQPAGDEVASGEAELDEEQLDDDPDEEDAAKKADDDRAELNTAS